MSICVRVQVSIQLRTLIFSTKKSHPQKVKKDSEIERLGLGLELAPGGDSFIFVFGDIRIPKFNFILKELLCIFLKSGNYPF